MLPKPWNLSETLQQQLRRRIHYRLRHITQAVAMSSYDSYMPKMDRGKNTSSPSASSSMILKRQYRDMQKNPVQGFSCGLLNEDNFYEWEVLIIGPQDTVYEGGFLKAKLTFPHEYPLLPPKMKVSNRSCQRLTTVHNRHVAPEHLLRRNCLYFDPPRTR